MSADRKDIHSIPGTRYPGRPGNPEDTQFTLLASLDQNPVSSGDSFEDTGGLWGVSTGVCGAIFGYCAAMATSVNRKPMSFKIISGVLSADVLANGTFTIAYPTGTNSGNYSAGVNHALAVNQNILANQSQFLLTFGAPSGTNLITVTNKTSGTWTAGSTFSLQAELIGITQYTDADSGFSPINVARAIVLAIPLGSPTTASSTFLAASQSIASSGSAVLAATVLDSPRNVVAAWTGTAIITVTGKDVFGNTMTESSASGTSFTGVKAFSTITSITSNASITGFTAGNGVALGLPVYLPSSGFVLREIVNGAAAGTAGTFVGGLIASASTATSADVRGTYSPNSAPNGSNSYTLIVSLPDAGYRGVAQA